MSDIQNTPELVPNFCIHHLLNTQAKKTPDAVAIIAPERKPLTYQGLCHQVDTVVDNLNAIGLGCNDRVAIALPNSPEMAVTFLAVASGATCAPLNPAYRAKEFDFYLADLNAKALIVQSGVTTPARTIAQERGIPLIELSPLLEAEAGIFTLTTDKPKRSGTKGFAQSEDVALVLHTSGTTSRPKIVPLTHKNLCTSAYNIRAALNLIADDRCLNVMPLFHIHGLIGTLLSSLTAGASVVCPPSFYAPKFFEWLEEFRPTWYSAVPTMHQAILARADANHDLIAQIPIRLIRSSSAPLPSQVMAKLEKVFNAPVINSYGMTEASHQMASNPLPPKVRKSGSVGVAAGPEIAIMDEAGELLQLGEVGEVVIKGANVTQGYENNPDANEKAFVNSWFRTGDLGYLDSDNYLFLKGRIKEIINRGGEKISPHEVDQVLLDHPAITQVVTFAVPNSSLGEEVAAAIVLREGTSVTELEIIEFAAKRLADFKVPRVVVFVEEIPKGPTGKLQRIGLAEKLGLTTSDLTDSKPKYASPRTTIEAKLAEIWSEVLGIEQVGIYDNFFQLGGDSILALQIVNRVQATMKVELPFLIFFQQPTVASIALEITQSEDKIKVNQKQSILPRINRELTPLSFAQEVLFRLGDPAFNRTTNIRLAGQLDVAALEQSLNEIVRRHEILRTSFPRVDGQPVQKITSTLTLKLPIIDITHIPENEQEAKTQHLVLQEAQQPFNLSQLPLLSATLLRLSEKDHVLVLTMHHIISDYWSDEIFFSELSTLYAAFSTGASFPLPELPIQYADFAYWERLYFTGEVMASRLNYWKQQLADIPPLLELPINRRRSSLQTFQGGIKQFQLSLDLTQKLKTLSQKSGTTLSMTLFTVFVALLFYYSGQEDIVVGFPTITRNRFETEPLIGVFVNILVLRTQLQRNPTFLELLAQVQQVAVDAYDHDVPINQLVEALQPKLIHNPLSPFNVAFNSHNIQQKKVELPGLTATKMEFYRPISGWTVDLTLLVEETDSELRGTFRYNANLFDTATINQIVSHFQTLVEAVVLNPEQYIAELSLTLQNKGMIY